MLRPKYEIRCPIHGFVRLTALERDLINHPAFQRLRRIRQLAWTDFVYPGAMHTRFEHSLGVMHLADRIFQSVYDRNADVLRSVYNFHEGSLDRYQQVIRLAALVHDVGHGPFSHAAEDLFPDKENGKKWKHEDYSAGVLDYCLSDVIHNHPESQNWGIRVDDIKRVFYAPTSQSIDLVWKNIVAGQLDADRMDYLLRDSYHCGVKYGSFDVLRLLPEICLVEDPETNGHLLGITEDALHAAEGLIIARFMMFTQVYFHKTRVIYDFHLGECLKMLLSDTGGKFPPPSKDGIPSFLKWDDWVVQGMISKGGGGEHGQILRERDHYRRIFETTEVPTREELDKFQLVKERLGDLGVVSRDAKKSWYNLGDEQIRVLQFLNSNQPSGTPLSELSPVVRGLTAVNQRRLYVPKGRRDAATERLNAI